MFTCAYIQALSENYGERSESVCVGYRYGDVVEVVAGTDINRRLSNNR